MVRANFAGNQNMPTEFMATGLAPRPVEETRLSGVVMTPDFRAIPGVTVIFEGRGVNAGARSETTTNENGAFAFFNVPPGNDQLLIVKGGTATLPGRFPDLTFDIDVLPGQDNKTGRRNGRGKPIFLPLLNEGAIINVDVNGMVLEDQVVEFDAGQGLKPRMAIGRVFRESRCCSLKGPTSGNRTREIRPSGMRGGLAKRELWY